MCIHSLLEIISLESVLFGSSLQDEEMCIYSLLELLSMASVLLESLWVYEQSKCASTLCWKSFLWKVYCLDNNWKMIKCVPTLRWNSCLWQVYCWNHYGFMSKANVHLLSVGNHFSGKCTVWIITGR